MKQEVSQFLFRLPKDVKQQLKIISVKRDVSLSQLLGELVEKFLRETEG